MTADSTARAVMARLDHNAIFLLIAGTFTPAHIILFRGPARWLPLLVIWTAAILGVVLKSVFFDDFQESVGLAFYLLMGWFGLVSGGMIAWRHGWRSVQTLFWGGVAYTVGAAFDFARWPQLIPSVVHAHEVFHVAILIGVGLHWLWVWRFARGGPSAPRQSRPQTRRASAAPTV
jgi:channel protein (hemolysin III family)